MVSLLCQAYRKTPSSYRMRGANVSELRDCERSALTQAFKLVAKGGCDDKGVLKVKLEDALCLGCPSGTPFAIG